MFDMASLDMDKPRHKKVRAGGEPARAGLPCNNVLPTAFCVLQLHGCTSHCASQLQLPSALCVLQLPDCNNSSTAYCNCTLRTAPSTATTHCVLQLQQLRLLRQPLSAYYDCNFYRNHSLRIATATATSTATHCSLLLQLLTAYSDNSLQGVACRNRLKRFRSVRA